MNKISNFFSKEKIFFLILSINIFALLTTLSNTYTDGYNLRQAQTAIFARNIFYDNFNIFPTRLTFFAPNDGNIIFEFPFIHFLTALTYKLFPISEINGRIVNLLFYIFNGFLFFKIQKLIFRNNIATITSSLYISSPLILYLGHAYMPETSMMTFYLLAYYFFIKNKNIPDKKNEILMFISLAIGPLLKPPAGILFLPIFIDYLNESKFLDIIKKSIPFFICALPLISWMIYGYLVNSSELSSGSNWNWVNILSGKGSLIETWIDINFYKNILFYFLIQHLNPLTFLLSIYGILYNFRSKNKITEFHLNWLFSNLLFLFIFAGANKGHPYYQIFFIPNLIFFIGLAIKNIDKSTINKKIIIGFSIFFNLFLSISVFIYGSSEKLRISNVNEFKKVVSNNIEINKKLPKEYILYSHKGLASPPVYTYYADSYSKLYSVESDDLLKLKNEIKTGAKYIFFINTSYGDTIKILKNNKKVFNWLKTNQEKLYESESLILYKLKN